jgi:hypothetical protein
MDMGVAFLLKTEGRQPVRFARTSLQSRKIIQCEKKIIGKNQEEMFGFRKPIEGKN